MKNNIIIFEEIHNISRLVIKWYLLKRYKVYFIRMNVSCKRKKWAQLYIEKGWLTKLEKSFDILAPAAGLLPDLAYQNIERVSELIFKGDFLIEKMFTLYSDELISNVFKKGLLSELQRFYYINYIMNKLQLRFPDRRIKFVPTLKKEHHRKNIIGINSYYYFLHKIKQCNAFCFENKNVIFPLWFVFTSNILEFYKFLFVNLKIISFFCWCILKFLLDFTFTRFSKSKKESFKFGIMIIGPVRQFANRIQKVDFLIDEKQIMKKDAIFISVKKLSKINKEYFIVNNLRFTENLLADLSHESIREVFPYIYYLLINLIKYRKKIFILNSTLLTLACYVIWGSFSRKFNLDNLVTYCDFGSQSIARNILLNKHSNTKTWYYIESNNWINLFVSKNNIRNINQYDLATVGFLYFDYFVSWSDELIRHCQKHHQDIENYISIGCLWSEHIREINEGKIKSEIKGTLYKNGYEDKYKLLSVFDSTYIDNSIIDYDDGIFFLRNIYRLLEEIPDIFILFKEKKPRYSLSVRRSPKEIFYWFEKLNFHPRCYLAPNYISASEIIAISDLTISFPFSSTTFEALSSRNKGLYYDASDKFRGTFYDLIPGLVMHSYDDLLQRVKELLFDISEGEYNSYLDEYVKRKVDPYLDGYALTRFRELLTNPGAFLANKIKVNATNRTSTNKVIANSKFL